MSRRNVTCCTWRARHTSLPQALSWEVWRGRGCFIRCTSSTFSGKEYANSCCTQNFAKPNETSKVMPSKSTAFIVKALFSRFYTFCYLWSTFACICLHVKNKVSSFHCVHCVQYETQPPEFIFTFAWGFFTGSRDGGMVQGGVLPKKPQAYLKWHLYWSVVSHQGTHPACESSGHFSHLSCFHQASLFIFFSLVHRLHGEPQVGNV